jgi:thioredoxin 1
MEKTIKVIDFYADWCGPCKALSPILDKLATNYPQIDLQKVDVENENNEDLALQYNVLSIPKVVVEIDGKVVKTFTGAKPYPAIEADLKEWLNG